MGNAVQFAENGKELPLAAIQASLGPERTTVEEPSVFLTTAKLDTQLQQNLVGE